MSVRPHLIVTVLGAAAVAGCGKSSISWKEEVLLANAEVIVVERSAKTKAFGEIGGPGGWENEGMTVEIVKPSLADKPPVWNGEQDHTIATKTAVSSDPQIAPEFQKILDKWSTGC